jgi:hypothetical protein
MEAASQSAFSQPVPPVLIRRRHQHDKLLRRTRYLNAVVFVASLAILCWTAAGYPRVAASLWHLYTTCSVLIVLSTVAHSLFLPFDSQPQGCVYYGRALAVLIGLHIFFTVMAALLSSPPALFSWSASTVLVVIVMGPACFAAHFCTQLATEARKLELQFFTAVR